MPYPTSSYDNPLVTQAAPATGVYVGFGVGLWFGIICLLGTGEVFVAPPRTPPLALVLAVAAPLIAFIGAFCASNRFHEFVLGLDLRFLTAIQAWRMGGRSFLALYTFGILPGYFAWPAGLGDMAVGVTAPWIILALMRRPAFAAGKTFVAWNIFGILDLVIAVTMGGFGPRFFSDPNLGADATAPMSYMPLVLVPAFFVPLFIILHLSALFQARRLAAEIRS
jgi:hypothetical protein